MRLTKARNMLMGDIWDDWVFIDAIVHCAVIVNKAHAFLKLNILSLIGVQTVLQFTLMYLITDTSGENAVFNVNFIRVWNYSIQYLMTFGLGYTKLPALIFIYS